MPGPTLPIDGVTTGPSRARCPVCTRDITLTPTGTLGPHGYVRIPGHRNLGGCPAAGLTPTQARARLAARTTPTS